MSWKFWEKNASGVKGTKLPRPEGMPNQVGRDLVVNKGEDADWVWGLKCAKRQREKKNDSYDFRVFDEADAAKKGISVRNYTSLDQAPELILFEGWYDKKNNKAEVIKRN